MNNIQNYTFTKTDKLKINKEIIFPNTSNSKDIEGNVRYNSSTGKLQLYSGAAWHDIDISTGANYWQINSTTYIEPLSTYTNGIKVNNITAQTGGSGIKLNSKCYVNDIESYGSNHDLNFYTNGTGAFNFEIDPTTTTTGKMQIFAPNLSVGGYVDYYIGRSNVNMTFMGYYYGNTLAQTYTYFGCLNSPKDYRFKLYGDGILSFDGSQIDCVNGVETENAKTYIRVGSSSTNLGLLTHNYSTTVTNKYLSISYNGQTESIKIYGDGKLSLNNPYCDNIYGITDADSGNVFGVPVTNAKISVDNIQFSPWTLRQFVNNTSSSGVIGSPPTMTDNGNGTVNIGSCKVQIRATNSPDADLLFLDVAESTQSTAIDDVMYYYVIYSGGNAIYVPSSSVFTNYQTNILIAKVYRVPIAQGNELYINNKVCTCVQDLPKRVINSTGVKLGEIKYESGAKLGFLNTQFNVTAGYFYCGMNMIETTSKGNVANFVYLKYNGSSFIELTPTNTIDNTTYQGASDFTAMTANRWAVDFVYITLDNTTRYYVIKSTSEATSLATALEITLPTSIPKRLINNGILVGKIVFQKSQNINSVYSAFSNGISYQGISSHSNLSNLTSDDHTQYVLINVAQRQISDTLIINEIASPSTGALDKDITITCDGGKINCQCSLVLPDHTLAVTTEGELNYDFTQHCLIFYNGTGWITLGKNGSNDFKIDTTNNKYGIENNTYKYLHERLIPIVNEIKKCKKITKN